MCWNGSAPIGNGAIHILTRETIIIDALLASTWSDPSYFVIGGSLLMNMPAGRNRHPNALRVLPRRFFVLASLPLYQDATLFCGVYRSTWCLVGSRGGLGDDCTLCAAHTLGARFLKCSMTEFGNCPPVSRLFHRCILTRWLSVRLLTVSGLREGGQPVTR